MLVHGGRFRAGTSGDYTIFGDTWAFDLSAEAWSEIDTSSPPPPRLYHAATTDGERLYVYGGGDEGAFLGDFLSDLWAFDPANATWTELHDGSGNAPGARIWANLEFDGSGERLLLFGGHDDGVLGNNNELWSFNLGNQKWKRLIEGDVFSTPQNDVCDFPADFTVIDADAPERRDAAASAVADGEMLVFGGKTDCGNINDVWSWTFASETWSNVSRATEGEVCLRAYQECTSMCF